MTREEAIIILKHPNEEYHGSDGTTGYTFYPNRKNFEAFQLVIKALEQPETVTEFADRCKECGARYGKMLKEESWILCSEKLPDQYKHVLVTACEGYIEIGYYDGKAWSVGDGIFYRTDEIPAWQPLPEPYKEDKE